MNSSIDNQYPDLAQVASLDSARWERARNNARETIRNRARKPDPKRFQPRGFGRFPAYVNVGMILLLAVVAASAFWISAGKQIAATDLVLKPVIEDYKRLSTGWVDIGIVLNLLLGEIGTVFFFTASGIFPGAMIRIKSIQINKLALAFRVAGVLCAVFALAANITISAKHPQSDVWFYNWYLTLAAPIIVLFIGLFAERFLLSALDERATMREAYNTAYDGYEKLLNDPEHDPQFRNVWGNEVIDQLRKVSPKNKSAVDGLIELDPDNRSRLFHRERVKHDQFIRDLEQVIENPTTPLLNKLPAPAMGFSALASHNSSERQ